MAEKNDRAANLSAEDRGILFEEIGNLPEAAQTAVALHHLEGKSYEEAALQLGLDTKTFSMRLSRAREKLRRRLLRRGIIFSGAVLASTLGEAATAAELPAILISTTSKAAIGALGAKAIAGGGLISAKVSAFAEGAAKMLFWTQVKTFASAAVITVAVASVPAGVAISQSAGHKTESKIITEPKADKKQEAENNFTFAVHEGDPRECAALYRKAFYMLKGRTVPLDDSSRIAPFPARFTDEQAEEFRPVYELALKAAKYRDVDWGYEQTDIVSTRDYIQSLNELVSVVMGIGRYELECGSTEGFNAIAAAHMMGRHSAQEGQLLSVICQQRLYEKVLITLAHTHISVPRREFSLCADQLEALPGCARLYDITLDQLNIEISALVEKYNKEGSARFSRWWDKHHSSYAGPKSMLGIKSPYKRREILDEAEDLWRKFNARFYEILRLPRSEQLGEIRKLQEKTFHTENPILARTMPLPEAMLQTDYFCRLTRPLLVALCRVASGERPSSYNDLTDPYNDSHLLLENAPDFVRTEIGKYKQANRFICQLNLSGKDIERSEYLSPIFYTIDVLPELCAKQYELAFEKYDSLPDETEDTVKGILDGTINPTEDLLRLYGSAFAHAFLAATYRNVDWQLSYSGDGTRLKHLQRMRKLAYLTLACGKYYLERGDARGLKAIAACWMMGRHAAQGSMIHGYVMQFAIHRKIIETLSSSHIVVPQKDLPAFADTMTALPAAYSVSELLLSDKQIRLDYLRKTFDVFESRGDLEGWDRIWIGFPEMSISDMPEKERRPYMKKLFGQAEKYFDELAKCCRLNPKERDAAIDELHTRLNMQNCSLLKGLCVNIYLICLQQEDYSRAVCPSIAACCRYVVDRDDKRIKALVDSAAVGSLVLKPTHNGVEAVMGNGEPWPGKYGLILRLNLTGVDSEDTDVF